MQAFKPTILAASLAMLTGCASWDKSPICPKTHGWQAWPDVRCDAGSAPTDMAADASKLADELDAARKQNRALGSRVSDLERQLADRDRELASLRSGAADSAALANRLSTAQTERDRANAHIADLEKQLAAAKLGSSDRDRLAAELAAAQAQLGGQDKELAALRSDLSAEMAKLEEAQRGLVRALRPQINRGDIAVSLNDERLLISLASGYLFGSGEDQLKSEGIDALKQVGAILKEYPEYKVAVDGHTDNLPIRGALKKRFPTNMELSESRAAHAAEVLGKGGLSAVTTHGYADTKPKAPNTTDAGRAENRRVEVRVTK